MSRRCFTIVHTESSRGWGGQEIRILTEMVAMRSRGHRLMLACPPDATLSSKAEAQGIEVLHFSDHKTAYPASILSLKRYFAKNQVQVVNPHSSRDGWIAGIAARMAGVPCIIRSRHIEVDYPNPFLSRIPFHHLPHHVLTTSDKITRRLVHELNLNSRRVNCIPTGIDLDRFNPSARPALRESPGLPSNKTIVGMVSVLRSWKGHDDFLDAAKILVESGTAVHFVIAGDGPGRARLLEGIATRGLQKAVEWVGHREDVPNVLTSLDLLVLPSYAHEGIPQILLQAQASGVAVVGTEIGGIPEVIEHEKTGLLIPPRNPVAMARAVQNLIQNPSLRSKLAQNGLNHARQNHGLALMCERIEAIYEKIIPLNV